MFALVADGKNGLRVLQLVSPENVPGYMGFSPPPAPKLIATYPTRGEAITVSRGLDRDRVVDETGNQTVVFGRRGSRPFTEKEFASFIRKLDGQLFRVEDVTVKDRQLLTVAGQPVPAPKPFVSPPAEPTIPPRSTDRIMRRPSGTP